MVRIGVLSGSTPLHVVVALNPSDGADLPAYATAVSTPGNPLFHQYLSSAQFANRFGAPQAAISAVTTSLTSDGLAVGQVSGIHLSVSVSGTTKQLSQAFSTTFDRYRLPSGREIYANTAAPLIAGNAAPYVQGVIGLDDINVPQRAGVAAVPAGEAASAQPQVVTGGPQPCSTAVTDAASDGVYTDDESLRPTDSRVSTGQVMKAPE